MSTDVQMTTEVERGARRARRLLDERHRALSAQERPDPGILVAEGDSWLDYPGTDVLSVLEDRHGWQVHSVAHRGDNLEAMAYDGAQLGALTRTFERVAARRDDESVVLLLSGGGNDFAGPELAMLLDHLGTGHGGINETITTELVERRMRQAWANLLGFTGELATQLLGAPVRTVVHGYAYAVPDGRGFLGGFGALPGPWLAPSYARKGIGSDSEDPLQVRTALTRDLLDRYNAMLASVAGSPGLEHVVYTDLRGTLVAADHRDDWSNELHPTDHGFRRVAAELDRALTA